MGLVNSYMNTREFAKILYYFLLGGKCVEDGYHLLLLDIVKLALTKPAIGIDVVTQ